MININTRLRYLCNNEDMRVLKRADQVVVTNRFTGEWLKTSFEAFEIVQRFLDSGSCYDTFREYFDEKSDSLFIEEVLTSLETIRIIFPEGNNISHEIRPIINFAITNRCNLRCKHCSYLSDKHEDYSELSESQLIAMLGDINKTNPLSISITGGEPMLKECFIEISEHIRDNFQCEKTLMTNGTLITEDNVNRIITCYDGIDISVDGIDEATCSVIRGPGVFDRVISSINLLHKSNFTNISLSMVLVGQNQHLLSRFLELCESLKVRALPRHFIALNRGESNFEYLNLNTAQQIIEVSNEPLLPDKLDITATSCKAGFAEFFISPSGQLFPCPLLLDEKFQITQLSQEHPFSSFFDNRMFLGTSASQAMLQLEPENNERCRDCDVSQFCNSCPAEAAAYEGKIFRDKMCNHYKVPLQRIIWDS